MATPRIDLFAHPHQEQRLALFELSKAFCLQATAESQDLEYLVDKLQDTINVIKEHSDNENMFISPLLNAKGLQNENWLDKEHKHMDELLDELESLIIKIRTLHVDQQIDFCSKIYNTLNRFIGNYLLHIDKEEQQIMPLLRQHSTMEEIMGILVAFKAYKEPEVAKAMLPSILSNMTVEERVKMFASIKKHAPAAAYQASLSFTIAG